MGRKRPRAEIRERFAPYDHDVKDELGVALAVNRLRRLVRINKMPLTEARKRFQDDASD